MATSGNQQATAQLRDWMRRTVDARGLRSAAKHIGIHHQTVAAILAGLSVRRGSIALARQTFEAETTTGTP